MTSPAGRSPDHERGSPAASPEAERTLEGLGDGLRLLALRRLGDMDAAAEAVQETLTRALIALRGGRRIPADEIAPFVYGIARHVIADQCRQRARTTFASAEPASPDPDALGLLISEEERAAVIAAFAALSPADQEILRLSVVEGLNANELGLRRGEPPERIRKRKSRAVERLRQAFCRSPAPGHDPPASSIIEKKDARRPDLGGEGV